MSLSELIERVRDQKSLPKRVSSFDDRVDDFWRRASTTRQVMVVRDKVHLDWRYCQKPGYDYAIYQAERAGAILGYIITIARKVKFGRCNLRVGFIADILTLPDDEGKSIARALIITAINKLQKQQVDAVSGWMLKEAPYYHLMKSLGFWPRRTWLPFGAHLNSTKAANQLFQEHNNWFFTMGDNDTV